MFGSSSKQRPVKPPLTLPYPIPGPAGTDCGLSGRNAQRNQVSETGRSTMDKGSVSRTFDAVPWHLLLKLFNYRPYGDEMMEASVALVKSNALRNDVTKINLAVRVENVEFIGKEAIVTLADPTGTICGSVFADVFEVYEGIFEDGAVVMLHDVFAVLYPDRRAIGFKLDLNKSIHLTIKRDNIVRVFGLDEEFMGEMKPLQELYREEALRPPKANHETLRQQRSSRFLKSGKAKSSLERTVRTAPTQISNTAVPSRQFVRSENAGQNGRYPKNRRPKNYSNPERAKGRSENSQAQAAQVPSRPRAGNNRPYNQTPPAIISGAKRPSSHLGNASQQNQRPRIVHAPTSESRGSLEAKKKSSQTETDDAEFVALLGQFDIEDCVARASQRPNAAAEPAAEPAKEKAAPNIEELDCLFDGLGD